MESLTDPSAENSFGSVGLWQFQPDTAGAYGLHVDGAVDERADPAKSSHAAAQLLADRFTPRKSVRPSQESTGVTSMLLVLMTGTFSGIDQES